MVEDIQLLQDQANVARYGGEEKKRGRKKAINMGVINKYFYDIV